MYLPTSYTSLMLILVKKRKCIVYSVYVYYDSLEDLAILVVFCT